jgi:lycopene beta-cyclase
MIQIDSQRLLGTVIDARASKQLPVPCAFQKCVGYDVILNRAHGLKRPLLMDSTVFQKEGYRFVYVLPFDEKTVLIEDRRYSVTSDIDETDFELEIKNYAIQLGGGISSVIRREKMALPLPLKSWPEPVGLKIGMEAGLFHFTTGYSFTAAVVTAEQLSAAVKNGNLFAAYQKLQSRFARQNRFFTILNRMLFGAGRPIERRYIYEKFYSRPQHLVERFNAMGLKTIDRMRILLGRHPVSVMQRLKSAFTDAVIN